VLRDELAAWALRKDRQPMHRVDDQPPWSCTPDRTLSNRRAESVRIVPRQMPLLIRIANSGAPCSDNQVERDPPHPRVGHQRSAQGSAEPARPISACRAWHSWAACGLVTTSSRPSDGYAGRAAIFPGVVSGRSFLLWPWRRGASSRGGSRRLTPGSGAWLFQYPLLSSRPRNIGDRRAGDQRFSHQYFPRPAARVVRPRRRGARSRT
jgi:hypothetical protein